MAWGEGALDERPRVQEKEVVCARKKRNGSGGEE
jgi:hypothetical protein